MKNSRQILIIGLDGMPYRLIRDMASSGVMQNTEELIRSSRLQPMESSIPEVSCVSWSSIITGKNPGEHGIFGFTDIMPRSYGLRFPNYASLAAQPFWETHQDRRAVILNVPSTYPARAMNGIHVAGFVVPRIEKAVYPLEVLDSLQESDYRVDVNARKGHESIPLFLEDLEKTLSARIALAEKLWEEDWLTFMLVFTGTDRLGHFLWEAYEDERHSNHADFLEHLRKIDRAIGRFVDRLDKDAGIIMLSDHGFERLRAEVHVNRVLQDYGFLSLDRDKQGFSGIQSQSRAFALDPGRIYIHTEGKYPRGSVTAKQREAIVREIYTLFEELKVEGRPAVRDIYRREDIYVGARVDDAPDLVLVGDRGISLRAGLDQPSGDRESPFTGKHSQSDAFLLVCGLSETVVIENANVTDVVGIIDHMIEGG
ncbi:alkaline phosphatase family protein [Candidatus Bipolaricaulota bacterium]